MCILTYKASIFETYCIFIFISGVYMAKRLVEKNPDNKFHIIRCANSAPLFT